MVFLMAAGGFLRDRATEPVGRDQGIDISLAKVLAVLHSGGFLKILPRFRLAGCRIEYGGDLRGGNSQYVGHET